MASQAQDLKEAVAQKEDAAREKRLAVEKQLAELRQTIVGKDQALASQAQELKIAVAQKEESIAQVQKLRDSLRQETTQLTSRLTSAKSMVSSLETQKAELNTKVDQLAENQAKQLQELRGRLHASEQQSSASQKELAARNSELTAARQALAKPVQLDPAVQANLESQIASLKSELDSKSKSAIDQRHAHQQLKSEMSALQIRHANQLKGLLDRQSTVAVGTTTADFSSEMRAEIRAQEKRIMELESENHEAREQLAGLVKLRAKLESQVAPAKTATKTKRSSSKPKKKRSSRSGHSSGKDDLTQIVGIGKVFEGRLNKIGISTFKQIAAWGKEDAEALQDKLGLGDRINNEKWVKQAKALAKKK